MRRLVLALVWIVAAVAASGLAVLPAAAADAPTAPPVAVGPVTAGVDDFTFQSMDAQYTLGRKEDGTSTLKVVETFVALFPGTDQNHGMRRSIPDSYNGQPLHPHLISITDADGAPRPAEVDEDDGVYSMTSRADQYLHGAQTFVFTYTLENVTWHFPDTDSDEFYWDVNGVDWSQPFGTITATLQLDDGLAQALTGDAACYQGQQGATTPCQIAQAPDGAVIATASSVGPHQTMTMAVGFRSGTFTMFDSSYLASPWSWAQGIAGLGALAALVLAVVTRVRRLKDAPGRPVIIAEYEPPAHIDALHSAMLLSLRAKAIPAEVLEQAVGGSIRIVEGKRRMFGGYRLTAQLVDPTRADADGRMVLDGLFGPGALPGAEFEFGRQNSRFAKSGQRVLAQAEKNLVAHGLRQRVPGAVKRVPLLLSLGCLVAVAVLGWVAMDASVRGLWPVLVIIGAASAFVIVLLVLSRKPLTAEGAEVRDHLKGLKVFIEWAEADRIRMLQSPAGAERRPIDVNDPAQMLKLYEPLLPYAVVFGQERQWADQLAVLYGPDASPTWYAGSGAFNAAAFSASVNSLTSAATSSSSTSGGSSGGGSAGGGGGGGGGGGV